MKDRSPKLLPVRFSYPEAQSRKDGWGRLTRLSAVGGELLTRFQVERGQRLALTFDLVGERFEDLPAEVTAAAQDVDGYCAARLKFTDERTALRLERALRDILARSGETAPSGRIGGR